MPARSRSRPWTVYATDGTRIAELRATTAAIRATLPDAQIDEARGVVRMMPPAWGLHGRPVPLGGGESEEIFDPE